MRRALSLCLVAVVPATLAVAPADPRIGRIEAQVRGYADLDRFAGAVLVAENGRVLYRGGAGLADRELGVQATPDQRFVIGSMTKAFTSMLVLQEIHAGRLRLDEPVIEAWPGFPDPSAGRITIRHLLAHRSGLPHWGAVEGFLSREARLPWSAEELVQLYARQDLRFVPGEAEGYSSPGYVALGVVLETVTGRSYGDLLAERIFEPLGMHDSLLDDGATIVPGRIPSYRYNFLEARYDNAEYRDPSTTGATGGIVTTVDDLLLWDQALYGDRLLAGDGGEGAPQPAELAALLFDPAQGRAAYGWRVTQRDGVGKLVWHGGQVTGYRSRITRVPERGFTVIALANLRDAEVDEMSLDLCDILAGVDVKPPKRSLMKEVLRTSAGGGTDAAIARFDEILDANTGDYNTEPTELLIAAIELRSDGACERAAPLYEHWLATYDGSPYAPRALRDVADCRLRLGQAQLAATHIRGLEQLRPDDPALHELRSRLP